MQSLLDAYRNRTIRSGMSRETRVVLSLLLLGMGSSNPLPSAVNATVTEVTSALRIQGRTAYVSVAPSSSSPASLDEQALCLLLLLRSRSASVAQTLPRLAAYLAAGGGGRGGRGYYYMPSWSSQALAAVALAEYDRTRGSSQPALDLTADANGLAVLKASFRTGAVRPVTNSTAWEDLPAPAKGQTGELNFQVSGRGEVSVAASLHFVPAAPLPSPVYRGLYVEATLQMVDPATGRPAGQPLASVPLSSLVVLTVQISTPDDLSAVTLSVMMPGGLEPLDPALNPDVSSGCLLDFVDSYTWGRFFQRWWWPVCPAQETRPAVVTFNYAALRSGTSTVSITAVAASAGTFVFPPIRASVDEQPELMGSTATSSITVCADCAKPTYAKPAPPPKACPAACSGNGSCDPGTGTCACDEGYKGADCSAAVA
ncbi:hypothetical protein GPECTOR_1674g800 [Gonium pectorale]|uniref:EGF-like domain-containing protein n=1 Tax=Gonium pectorale TaxID=33097 RepID=A0A150FTD5_GONPE|nr:hypothetical protein GPECTOR_1674g800 [Gonium pectorale]|eukprot:KXZ40872.1 hypothetical protein GPECTOR_1674g800 [Gonium pectorale]